ncbi:four-jointed box protein 1-like [Littorina saxatilis]|uniref:four-jointed box protein 1-like n=1 Tax=Littorina saxatilis TaxID=31220 RepID=UPI0038B674CE
MYVAFIDWIPELIWKGAGVTMPALITEALTTGTTLTPDTVSTYLHSTSCNSGMDRDNSCLQEIEKELSRLAQWGTMVIFDYITSNHDRASGLTETSSHVRNLQQTTDGKLWLLDNEAGFFHSYQLIHRGSTTGIRLQRAHLRHLRSTCIFQRSLVRHLMEFVRRGDPAGALLAQVRMREPLFHHMTVDSDSRRLFVKLFSHRVFDVLEWIVHCRSMNSE